MVEFTTEVAAPAVLPSFSNARPIFTVVENSLPYDMRLLSYNIHKAIGGRDRRCVLQRIIDVIEAENPDICCLQEVARNHRRSLFNDQAKMLAEYFKAAAYVYQPTVYFKAGMYGNLILSRWPIVKKHQISLRLNTKKPRGAQMAVVKTPEGSFHLINCHLGLADLERRWQVERLLNHHLFRESNELATLIVGDYNDWRNRLHSGLLSQLGFAQITTPISRFRSFPAYLPLGSLDKAFRRGEIFVRNARVVHSALAKNASDHLPLVIDFHLDEHVFNGSGGSS
jgi:endonuclease/exonuclease/phosphatase family metal-dependent hydrolase